MASTIIYFFPYLWQKIDEEITDSRSNLCEYKLSELVIASIALFLLKQGSRNAMNESRKEGKFDSVSNNK